MIKQTSLLDHHHLSSSAYADSTIHPSESGIKSPDSWIHGKCSKPSVFENILPITDLKFQLKYD